MKERGLCSCRSVDAYSHLASDPVGGQESDATDLLGEPVGILGEQRLSLVPVPIQHAPRETGTEAVAPEEGHGLGLGSVGGHGIGDALGEPLPDAADLPEALWLLHDDPERIGEERTSQLADHEE